MSVTKWLMGGVWGLLFAVAPMMVLKVNLTWLQLGLLFLTGFVLRVGFYFRR